MSPIPSWTPQSPRPLWDQPGTAERWEPHGSCGCQHLHPDLPQLQTKGFNSISIILLCSLGSFLPARWNFAGSTVNASLFFVLGSNWSDNKFVDGLFSGHKHLVLVRLLFIPVTFSMGCQGACAECEPHSSCPLFIPALAKYKAKDLRHLQNTSVPAGLPWPKEIPWAGRDRAPVEITAADLGVLTRKWFVWRSGSFPGQDEISPGRTLQAKIYGEKREASGLVLRSD